MLLRSLCNYRLKYITVCNFKSFTVANTKLIYIISHPIKVSQSCCECSSAASSGNVALADKKEIKYTKAKIDEDWSDIASRWYKQYQAFVGISEVLEAQEKVSMLTNQLLEVQIKRRQLQRDVEEIHQQLLATHQRITKAELYSEDHYSLFEKARQLNGSLKTLQAQFIQAEEEERSIFTQLSTSIQYCHEKERTQAEQSKYWSILISVISASLAALITSINNWVRIKEIKDHASFLHKDAINKTDNLHAFFANMMATNDPSRDSLPQETLLQSIKNTVHDEMKQLFPSTQTETKDIHSDFPEVSYLKIAGSMLSGALIGIVITYNFLGSSGGGG